MAGTSLINVYDAEKPEIFGFGNLILTNNLPLLCIYKSSISGPLMKESGKEAPEDVNNKSDRSNHENHIFNICVSVD